MRIISKVALVAVAAMVGCSRGTPNSDAGGQDAGVIEPEVKTKGALQGTVIIGKEYTGEVVVYEMSFVGEIVKELARATTFDGGHFSVDLPYKSYQMLMIVASGGTYFDLVTSLPLPVHQAPESQISRIVTNYGQGNQLSNLAVTPFSKLHAALARKLAISNSSPVPNQSYAAWTVLKNIFSVDLLQTPFQDITSSISSTESRDETLRGLYLAGLSRMAKEIADKAGRKVDSSITVETLAGFLAKDLDANGILDGLTVTGDNNSRLRIPADGEPQLATYLDSQTLRYWLARATQNFINSRQNALPEKIDRYTYYEIQRLARSTAPELFGPNDQGPAAGLDGGGAIDVVPPVIRWWYPSPNAVVGGDNVGVYAEVTDDFDVKSMRFTEPLSLASVKPTLWEHNGTLFGHLDATKWPNGPLKISVEVDDGANKSVHSVTVVVGNNLPTMKLVLPSMGDAGSQAQKGVVKIRVEATPQAPATSIQNVSIVNPPPGMSDRRGGYDLFEADWDTTVAPEGVNVLTFEATDNLNLKSTAQFSIEVQNYDFAKIRARVTLGGPIVGALVEAFALDPKTGQDVDGGGDSGIPVWGRLGWSDKGTDENGVVEFSLNVKNYRGPIGLRARKTLDADNKYKAQYVDPYSGERVDLSDRYDLLTTSVASYNTNQPPGPERDLNLPINGWTTLADAFLQTYSARGFSDTYVDSFRAIDIAVNTHFDSRGTRWNVRASQPANLLVSSGYLSDEVTFATIADYMFPALAKTISETTRRPPTYYSDYSALGVLKLLKYDLSSLRLDGIGFDGLRLYIQGEQSEARFTYDSNVTRTLAATSLYKLLKQPWVAARISSELMLEALRTMAADTNYYLYLPYENPPPWTPPAPIVAPGGK